MSRLTILFTKKISAASVAALTLKNIEPVMETFIETHPAPPIENRSAALTAAKDSATAIVFTSQRAVEYAAAQFGSDNIFPHIFCLEGATRELVIEHFGTASITGAAANAAELAGRIIAAQKFNTVIFFCGDKRRDELPFLLTEKGIDVKEIQVYKTVLTPKKINTLTAGIVFFSPSAAESFFSMNSIPENTVCFAIGSTTASALTRFTSNLVITSREASEENIIETILHFVEQSTAINSRLKK